ncbi:PIN domain-containing protein [Okeania sp. KiyG1]|uniref:type II toxin-antitoxin system VapC family toxin n=1 Tax=Okeania sp. KiyG1 TaxID=2720165 RepID=UPI0019209675|nr:PIN domain-containing protein [Okeania sp. KiyG1]
MRPSNKFPNLTLCSITRATVITAANLRGSSNLGLVDALHLATAIEAGCTIFLTNDTALRHPSPGYRYLDACRDRRLNKW